ncbi:hypothetical protein QQX98_000453 [Neonectria punicea]|uniref:NADH:ubiquinone oxidoreductase intermediate-associated protein 30 domain-containing protein n=1 Tax=Neonectria punicea TaxID=979145 RepID=A0ABR1HUW5_9HYPO
MSIRRFMLRASSFLPLFSPWEKSQWIASDDTVRNGTSQSFLDIVEPGALENPFSQSIAKFYGHLDYDTLGGSGFASQRTINDWPGLDLSDYDHILVEIPYTDGKKYTINLKDTVLPPTESGAEQATISWEFDFQLPVTETKQRKGAIDRVVINFADLVPTFRGRVQNDTAPLDLANIKRVSIMIRR